MTLGNKTISNNKNSVCADEYGSASSVIMYVTFNGVIGKNSVVVPFQTTTTTTTTATTTTATSTGSILIKIVEVN